MSKDYYKILGVDKTANAEELKRAFHKLAHKYHPDKAGGDEAKFKEANEAYQVLSNKEKRAQYDQFGQTFSGAGSNASGGGAGFGGFNPGNGGQFDFGDLGDMFGSFGDIFGFGGGGGRQSGGADIEAALELDFLEAAFGVEKELRLRKAVSCNHCGGSGAEPGAKIDTCSTCRGSGRVTKIQRTILGNVQMAAVCDACLGRGRKASKNCTECGGEGIKNDTTSLSIKVPAGVNDGESIKFVGQGQAGPHGTPSGDLYLRVRVRADKRWNRVGNDIKTRLEITYSEAVLGTKKAVETIDGEAILKIPEATVSGQVIAIRGRGVPRLRGGGRGDHLVEVVIKVPGKLSRSQRKILEELAKEGL